ncbi:MAG: DUF4249 domain-containing protein [Bacteroidales bacterium]|nr:DUF4249 domain-containing protein [Bacteroidales bacterium]
MRYSLLIILILILTVFSSCTEKIDIELDSSTARLVVYGEITTDTCAHRISLKKSADYYLNEPAQGISGARVEVRYADSSLLFTEKPVGTGNYYSPDDFFGMAGITYSLLISGVDIDLDGVDEDYSASSFLPTVNPLDSIGLKHTAVHFFSGWEVMVYAWDPLDVRNFYSFKVWLNGELQTDTLSEYVVQNDDFFNGSYTNGITSQFLDDSKSAEKAFPGDTVIFEINGITEEYYNFINEARTETFMRAPLFSGPPANITTNISNGALGFFTAYSIDRAVKIVPEYPDK